MKSSEKKNQNIKVTILLILIIFATRLIYILPWWSFIIPTILFGVSQKLLKIPLTPFLVGFIAGFIVWFCSMLYFDMTLNGTILSKIGVLLFVPKLVVMVISGLIGGILSGLSLYIGNTFFQYESAPDFN
ncbi:hypothetical protein ACSBL2_12100 [Pedobacter sp. AW31-3R]|uniref:hypothetical protein n=1 Tax=Pedobacter sp. AW31-3R TaxID=3445781 RepID=UPI003FA1839D